MKGIVTINPDDLSNPVILELLENGYTVEVERRLVRGNWLYRGPIKTEGWFMVVGSSK